VIRVSIVSDSSARSRRIAEMLADDDRIEVLQADGPSILAEVVVAATAGTKLPAGSNVVFLSDDDRITFEPRARAWLPLSVTGAELIAAIIAAANDLTVLTQAQVQRRLPSRMSTQDSYDGAIEPLTNREFQVLRMLANGLGNKEIADQLRMSNHTAKFHVAQILAKLGAASRTEAVMIAIRHGLVPI